MIVVLMCDCDYAEKDWRRCVSGNSMSNAVLCCFSFPTDYRCSICCQTDSGWRESGYAGDMGELEATWS